MERVRERGRERACGEGTGEGTGGHGRGHGRVGEGVDCGVRSDDRGWSVMTSSAKTGENVELAFQNLAEKILDITLSSAKSGIEV